MDYIRSYGIRLALNNFVLIVDLPSEYKHIRSYLTDCNRTAQFEATSQGKSYSFWLVFERSCLRLSYQRNIAVEWLAIVLRNWEEVSRLWD
jgi:hypothetical protein